MKEQEGTVGRSRFPTPPNGLREPGGDLVQPTGRPARRAAASQIPEPRSRRPQPHGSVRERNFLLRRPLSGPGVCGGGEARRPPPPGSSSSPRPAQRARASAPRARPPLTPPRPTAVAEPPRLRGVGGSRAAALGPRARGRRWLIPRSAPGRRAAAGARAREQPRLGRAEVGSVSFLPRPHRLPGPRSRSHWRRR